MAKSNISIKVGEKVRLYREKLGLSQEQLALKAGLYRTYIGQIERAEKNITLVSLEKIAKALEVEIIKLIN